MFLRYTKGPVREYIAERAPHRMPVHPRNCMVFVQSLKDHSKKKKRILNLCWNHAFMKCCVQLPLKICIALILFHLNLSWIINECKQYHPCSINFRVLLIKNASLNSLSKAIYQWSGFACLSKFQSHKSVSHKPFSAK